MKAIIFILSALFAPTVRAQTPVIPWAERQPAWVFPLYFEDATGAKDTLYWGWDPQANEKLTDDSLGEIRVSLREGFNVFWMTSDNNTIEEPKIKALVSPAIIGGPSAHYTLARDTFLSSYHFTIGSVAAVSPVTMRFDVGFLETDAFPWNNSHFPQTILYVYGKQSFDGFYGCIASDGEPCPYAYITRDTALVRRYACHNSHSFSTKPLYYDCRDMGMIKSDSMSFDTDSTGIIQRTYYAEYLEQWTQGTLWFELRPSASCPPGYAFWTYGCGNVSRNKTVEYPKTTAFYDGTHIQFNAIPSEGFRFKLCDVVGRTIVDETRIFPGDKVKTSPSPGVYYFTLRNGNDETIRHNKLFIPHR